MKCVWCAETLAHGAASWQGDTGPRFSLFYKYNDRAATYGYPEERRPSDEAFAMVRGPLWVVVDASVANFSIHLANLEGGLWVADE